MRLSTLYQPYTDDNPVCQDIRCLATVVSLVLRFANELGLNRLRTRDLYDRGYKGWPRRIDRTYGMDAW